MTDVVALTIRRLAIPSTTRDEGAAVDFVARIDEVIRHRRAGVGVAEGLSRQTPVIVKYRDERTDLATALESGLR